jgi:RNAse (barnase) inhibitor barstar
MSYEKILRNPAWSGVRRLPANAEAIAHAAAANGFVLWRVDLADVREKGELLTALARAIGFPDWFGGNWDALQDCLGDLSWRPAPGYVVVLEHCGGFAERAPKEFQTGLEIFSAAAHYWHGQGVPFWVLVGGLDAGQHELPGMNAAE